MLNEVNRLDTPLCDRRFAQAQVAAKVKTYEEPSRRSALHSQAALRSRDDVLLDGGEFSEAAKKLRLGFVSE